MASPTEEHARELLADVLELKQEGADALGQMLTECKDTLTSLSVRAGASRGGCAVAGKVDGRSGGHRKPGSGV